MITQSERNAKARKALKEAGGKRIDVQLSREGVEALEALKALWPGESAVAIIATCIIDRAHTNAAEFTSKISLKEEGA